MKNGLIFEDDGLVYYENDHARHAGVIKVNGDIYYISRHGRAVKGQHVVHGEMSNGLLERGTYTFGDDYKLVEGSYIAPKRVKSKSSRSKRSRRSRRFRLGDKWGAYAMPLCVLSLFLLFCLLMFVVEIDFQELADKAGDKNVSQAGNVVIPNFDQEVLLCTKEAKGLYDGNATIAQAIKAGVPYKAFTFEYDLGGQSGHLLVSEHADLSGSEEYVLAAGSKSVSIDNLKTNTTYYFKVTVGEEVYSGSFKTAESTRFIHIPGVYNTRDIGGYTTLDGKTVKQGVLIRGTELDGLVETLYFLDSADVDAVQEAFGFVCDMDLRDTTVYTGTYRSRLGEEVSHAFYAAPAYGAIFNESYQPALKTVFSELADPQNYPMYMHCTYGADRTGTVVYLLQGLLNMDEKAMLREYQMTGFLHQRYAASDDMAVVRAGLENYSGDTLQEKIVNFLMTDIGVTQAEIDSIRTIFLEN